MKAEPERDLAWGANRSREGLHNEFLVQKILHVEEHIRRLMDLAGNSEIDGRKTTKSSRGIVGIVVVLGARVMICRTDIHESLVGVGEPRGSPVPGHLC